MEKMMNTKIQLENKELKKKTISDFFEFLKELITIFDGISRILELKKEKIPKYVNIDQYINFLKEHLENCNEEIFSLENLDLKIWREDDYENNFWELIMRDISNKLLKILLFEMEGLDSPYKTQLIQGNKKTQTTNQSTTIDKDLNENNKKNPDLIINSMLWLKLYSLALMNYYEEAFSNETTNEKNTIAIYENNKLDELKFFTYMLKDNIVIFSKDNKDMFFYYLYKLSGLHFDFGEEYFSMKTNFELNIKDNIEKFAYIDDVFRQKIENLVLPINIDDSGSTIDLFHLFVDKKRKYNIVPFKFFADLKAENLGTKLKDFILNQHELVLNFEYDTDLGDMKFGLFQLINSCILENFFKDPIYFIRTKIFTDVLNSKAFSSNENILTFFSSYGNFECYYGDIKIFLSNLRSLLKQNSQEDVLRDYLDKEGFLLEVRRFEESYIPILESFLNELFNNYNESNNNIDWVSIKYDLFAFSVECLFFTTFFINEGKLNSYKERVNKVWEAFSLLFEIKKKKIVVANIPLFETTKYTDFYQYLVYFVDYLTNFNNQQQISELKIKRRLLEDIIMKKGNSLQKKIEEILNSKVIRNYYACLDNDQTDNKYLIPNLIRDGKFWIKIKYLKLFTSHSGMTLPQLIIILNDHLPGVYDIKSYDRDKIDIMIEGSIIYIIIHEVNYLNRMLNHEGESSKENSTPRNNKLQTIFDSEPEGGRYKCAALFGRNYSSLSLQQAEFIINVDNWNPILENKNSENLKESDKIDKSRDFEEAESINESGNMHESEKLRESEKIQKNENLKESHFNETLDRKALYVVHFRKKFMNLIQPEKETDRIKMMNNEKTKEKDTLCFKPRRD